MLAELFPIHPSAQTLTLTDQTCSASACFAMGLRWFVAAQCLGYAAALGAPSNLNSWLLPEYGDAFAGAADAGAALALWLAGWALPFLGRASAGGPNGGTCGNSLVEKTDAVLLLFAAAWAFGNAAISWASFLGDRFHATDLIGHAARYSAPLALLVMRGEHCSSPVVFRRLEWVLRLAMAGTFVGHGLCAYWLKPGFADLIVGTADTFLGADWEAAEARERFALAVLPWIGRMDFVLAALFLLPGKHLRAVALLMGVWGVVTAASRMTAFGWERWPDLLVRAANGGIPLLFWWRWKVLAVNVSSR